MFYRPEDVLDYLYGVISDNKEALGIVTVGYGTENLVPIYPACILSAGSTLRELHSTRTFLVTYEMNLWIYHADMDASHAVRTKEDLQLVTEIVQLLHSNFQAITPSQPSGQLIFSYVHTEEPGIAQNRRSNAIVATRLVWTGENRVPFAES